MSPITSTKRRFSTDLIAEQWEMIRPWSNENGTWAVPP
jgi:hypothetical protein